MMLKEERDRFGIDEEDYTYKVYLDEGNHMFLGEVEDIVKEIFVDTNERRR